MQKLDLTKQYKNYYTAKSVPEVVDIQRVHYLSICGKGDPSGELFSHKLQALYSLAYTIKFSCKAAGNDFTVAKLEALWWFDENLHAGLSITNAPGKVPRNEWEYRLLIRLPDFVLEKEVEQAKKIVSGKKKIDYINDVVFFEMTEGKCVQMLHVGPFDKEPETLLEMQGFMSANNFHRNGKHHEIYLSDFRKTKPEKLRTILREPVK